MKRVFRENFVGLKDNNDKLVVPVKYDYIWMPTNGYALVQRKCYYGLVRISDVAEIIPPIYSSISVKENYIVICNMGHYGICNMEGTVIVPTILNKGNLEELEKIIES